MEEKQVDIKYYNYMLECIKHVLLNTPLNPLPSNKDYIILYHIAREHDLLCLVYEGVKDYLQEDIKSQWENKVNLMIFKSISQMEEIETISSLFSENKISFCFLKGSILKTLYPEHYYREMADLDILVSKKDLKQTHKLLINNLGYWCESKQGSHHQAYMKKPIYEVEIHYELIDDDLPQFTYYKDFIKRLKPNNENPYKLEMTLDDYFVFMIFHAFHHYEECGMGLRYMVDLYIFLKQKEGQLNFTYIEKQLEILNLLSFYQTSLQAMKSIFEDKPENNEVASFKQYLMYSGTYGTNKNRVNNALKNNKGTKISYMLKRLFPAPKKLKTMYPILKKHPILYPFVYLSRPFKVLFSFGKVKDEIKEAVKYTSKKD